MKTINTSDLTGAAHTPGPWRYEAATKTIRAVPSNYWLASMDSWDKAVNHEANAQVMAAAPELLTALLAIVNEAGPKFGLDDGPGTINRMAYAARQAIAKAGGAA